MLLLKSAVNAGNTNLPQYTPSADELALYATNPTIWLEGKSKFENKTSNAFAWRERQVGTKFINAKSNLPNQVTLGSLTPIRMGFGGGTATQTSNGAVIPDASQALLPTNGQLTFCAVVRIPIRPGAGGVETAYNCGGFILGSHSATDTDVWGLINQSTGQCDFRIGNDTTVTHSTEMATGAYKMVTFSRGASTQKLYIDGTEVQSTAVVAKTLSGNALIPVVGAARSTYAFVPFVGDIVGYFVAPGGFHETPASLTALHNYFGALRTLAAAGG